MQNKASEWTEEERQIAASFIKNPETLAFLYKLYCPERSKVRLELENNIGLPNEQYGSIMKSLAIAEKHFAVCHANLKLIAAKETTESSPIAPV